MRPVRSVCVPAAVISGAAFFFGGLLAAQETRVLVDSSFTPTVADPTFAPGAGPLVLVDEAHHNLHTSEGYYRAFGALLEADGYRVGTLAERLESGVLAGADLLVIANALPVPDQAAADTLGSALTPDEVRSLLYWIDAGGNLLLFVDHRPYARSAAPLLEALGLHFTNGYALDYEVWDAVVFRRSDGTLPAHPITDGRDAEERVDSVATFYGDAFRAAPAGATEVAPLLRFGPGIDAFQPDELWAIGDGTPRVPVEGWLQGGAFAFGSGRVVVFGESGMAAAQLLGPKRVPRGMNTPVADQNARFLLNTVHWLTRALP